MSGSSPLGVAVRFLGARLDGEIVLLDRETNSLIRLDRDAVAVWEGRGSDEGVWGALHTAGLVRNVGGRTVSAAIEWV